MHLAITYIDTKWRSQLDFKRRCANQTAISPRRCVLITSDGNAASRYTAANKSAGIPILLLDWLNGCYFPFARTCPLCFRSRNISHMHPSARSSLSDRICGTTPCVISRSGTKTIYSQYLSRSGISRWLPRRRGIFIRFIVITVPSW